MKVAVAGAEGGGLFTSLSLFRPPQSQGLDQVMIV